MFNTSPWTISTHGIKFGINHLEINGPSKNHSYVSHNQRVNTSNDSHFSIKNGDFPIKHGDFPIKNGDFPIKHGDFPIKNGDVPIKHGDVPIKNGDFPIKNLQSHQSSAGHPPHPWIQISSCS